MKRRCFWYFAKYQYFRTKRAEIITKVNALNAVRNSVGKNLDNIINLNAAGVEDGTFNASVAELKTLYAKEQNFLPFTHRNQNLSKKLID